MKIGPITTQDVRLVNPEATLAAAGALFRDAACGSLPVVDKDRHVIGMITDRDLCLALVSRNARPSDVTVGEAMSRDVHACRPQDDVSVALKLMATYKVRRLPVCDDDDHLLGILSIDDIVLAGEKGPAGVPYDQIVQTLRLISESYLEKQTDRPAA